MKSLLPKIKLHFSDFWNGYRPDENIFLTLLRTKYEVELDEENPDLVIYSCFGKNYLKYKCTRVFFSCENMRPDFSACDYAITFDYNSRPNHYRFPLYGYYIDMYPKQLGKSVQNLFVKRDRETLKKEWLGKKKFCCMVVSNGAAKKRIDFFNKLSAIKQVDSGGKALNNVGGPVKDKLAFISDYKFVISFENSSYPGYTTEKVMEPIMAGSIPVYWGNELVGKDFNEKRILNYHSFPSEDKLIEKMLELEANPDAAVDMIMEAPFASGFEKPAFIKDENLLAFFDGIIKDRQFKKPVALTYKKYVHGLKLFWKRLNYLYDRVKFRLGL